MISHACYSQIQPWESRVCISVRVGGDGLHLGGIYTGSMNHTRGRRQRCGISSQTKAWALFTVKECEYSGSDSQRRPWTSWRRGTNTCRLFVKLLRNKIANMNMPHQWGIEDTPWQRKATSFDLKIYPKTFFLTEMWEQKDVRKMVPIQTSRGLVWIPFWPFFIKWNTDSE